MIESRFSLSLAAALVCMSLGFAHSATAADALVGSADAGATKAAVCTACHGVNGNSSNPEWPNLAGQNAAYTREQLAMFKARKRINEIMYPIVKDMSDQDIADVAAFFSAQTPTGLEADPSYWKAGEALYKSGDPARNIPACTACHGPSGQGVAGAGYPALRAQHSVYTVKQLQDYLTKNRYRDATDAAVVNQTRNSAMMTTIAARLSPEDIRNLASYLQGLR
ncbi:MAG TPA: c-type cytochrome [Steroidobacteraceae bacterium]|nr:c-type cytochrome [Steroidobacteraceae bacterium]